MHSDMYISIKKGNFHIENFHKAYNFWINKKR